jgi:hypothetical protein
MHRVGGLDLGHKLFCDRVDIADQQIVADLFERRLVRERPINQLRAFHDLLAPPQAGRQSALDLAGKIYFPTRECGFGSCRPHQEFAEEVNCFALLE